MIEVELPDGSIAEFPDGTTPDVIKGVLRKRFSAQLPDVKTDRQAPANLMGELSAALPDVKVGKPSPREQFDNLPWWGKPLVAADDLATVAGNDATFGYGAKAIAGLRSKIMGSDYESELSNIRSKVDDARDRSGLAGMAAGIGASVAPVGALMKAGVTANAIPKMPAFLGSVIDGAALGALAAHGNDKDVLTGAGLGALGGGAGDLVGKGLTKAFTPRVTTTADDISKRADDAYADLDASGALYSSQAIADALNATKQNFTKKGFHPKNQPGAAVALEELERVASSGLPVNTTGMQSLKETISGGFDDGIKANRKNNAMVMDAKKRIEQLLLAPQPGQVVGGDAVLAAKAYAEGNKAYSQKMKLEKIAKAIEGGEDAASVSGSGGNVENAIRQRLLRLKNEKGWTPDEAAQLKKAYGGTLGRTAARWLGNASPMGNGLMAGLWSGALTGAGVATGGASLPLMLMGAGITSGSKLAGQKLTKSAVKSLEDLILVGGSKTNLPKPSPKQQALIEAITRGLLVSGATVPQN